MDQKKFVCYKTLLISILLWGSIFGGVLVCKHLNEKKNDVPKKENKSIISREEMDFRAEQDRLSQDMLAWDRLSDPFFNTGIMAAYSATPENGYGHEANLSGTVYSDTDIFLADTCLSGLKFLIVSRRIGDNVALAVVQVKNTDNRPMLCTESY